MDPEILHAIEDVVRSQGGGEIPAWVRLFLVILTVQVSAISGKLGYDFYQSKRVDVTKTQILMGDRPERRQWDRHRCDEHLQRISEIETHFHAIEPKIARFEERSTVFIKRLESGDQKFQELNKNIGALSVTMGIMSDRLERYTRILEKNGGPIGN